MRANCGPIIERLDKDLDALRAKHPDYRIAATDLSARAARNSAAVSETFNRGLTLEFLFVAAFIGAAFRSLVVMQVRGILPVVLSGTILWLIGLGLQFASGVAPTVSCGVGDGRMAGHFSEPRRGSNIHPCGTG